MPPLSLELFSGSTPSLMPACQGLQLRGGSQAGISRRTKEEVIGIKGHVDNDAYESDLGLQVLCVWETLKAADSGWSGTNSIFPSCSLPKKCKSMSLPISPSISFTLPRVGHRAPSRAGIGEGPHRKDPLFGQLWLLASLVSQDSTFLPYKIQCNTPWASEQGSSLPLTTSPSLGWPTHTSPPTPNFHPRTLPS